jgi:uncharacterized protein (TIGR00251 family)
MTIRVKVIPRAKKEKIEEKDGVFKVYVTAPAVEGRANKQLIDLLCGYFHTKKYNINIISGERYRNKIIQII